MTAVLIGKFEQPVCYEGIQKLCFSCGRMGHRKTNCPYTIQPVLPEEVSKEEPVSCAKDTNRPCESHASEVPTMAVGQGLNVHGSVSEESKKGRTILGSLLSTKRMCKKIRGVMGPRL